MDILVLLEEGCGVAPEDLSVDAEVRILSADALVDAVAGRVIVTPVTKGAALKSALEAADFSVEVQPGVDPDAPHAGAHAELWGLGVQGYAEAITLIRGRS